MNIQAVLTKAASEMLEAFRTALIQQANDHADMFDTTNNQRAKQSAQAQLNACLAAYDQLGRIGRPAIDPNFSAEQAALAIASDRNQSIIAFNVACKLLDIPAHERTARIVEHFEKMAWN